MTSSMIETLIDADPIPALLGEDRGWTRVYGRTHGAAQATLVYEPETGSDGARCVQIGGGGEPVKGLGQVSSAPWWSDAALPALAGLRARHPGLRPIRYRPGKRCTLKLEADRPLFIKCVADDRGCRINADARLLNQASRQGLLTFNVARPAGWLPGIRVIAQHVITGNPVVPRIWHDVGLAHRLGEANASIAAASLRLSTRFTYADQMQRTAKYASRLAKRVAGADALLTDIMSTLGGVAPGDADRPIHGAPHAHQWLDGPDGIGLVDFDRLSLGDPELDVATFVAEADFEDAPGARLAAETYASAFEACWPLNTRLVQAYRAHKHVAKALRTISAIRHDCDARAFAILSDAKALLG
jgi:hypothetical protein